MNGNQKSTYYKILYCTPKVETLCMVHLEGLKSVHRVFSFFEGLHKLCINCVYTRSLSSAPLVRQVVKSSSRQGAASEVGLGSSGPSPVKRFTSSSSRFFFSSHSLMRSTSQCRPWTFQDSQVEPTIRH